MSDWKMPGKLLCSAGLICAALTLSPLCAYASEPPKQRATGEVSIDLPMDYPEYVHVSANLPSSYDGRNLGLVTPVRDQGDNGLCWDFAALAAMESSLLVNGWGQQDLSELHMAYATSDHSGNTAGFDRAPGDGGNRQYAACYLMRASSVASAYTPS